MVDCVFVPEKRKNKIHAILFFQKNEEDEEKSGRTARKHTSIA